ASCPATTELYTLSLHDALPISSADLHSAGGGSSHAVFRVDPARREPRIRKGQLQGVVRIDRARASASWKPLIIMPIYHILGEIRSEEHTSELQSRFDIVCRLLR